MEKKILGFIFSLMAMTFLTAIILLFFYSSPQFNIFLMWTERNVKLFFFILIILKVAGVVYPPLPGSIFTLSAIPIIGFETAYLAEFLGSVLGASISYFLGKRYGLTLVNKMFGETMGRKVEMASGRIKKDREFEGLVILRIAGGNIIEIINYGAGILGVSYKNFLMASIIAHPIVGIPVFYTAGKIFEGKNMTLYLGFMVLGLYLLYRFRGRYFE